MLFNELSLQGAYLITVEKREDERGFFARSWCQREFGNLNLNTNLAQCNISYSKCRGTLRGMHYQLAPHAECKLVRCVRGAIYDVIIDLRPQSPTFHKWFGVELTANDYRMLYVPEGFAHGFETLTDDTEVFYQVSEFYQPEAERGVRWNDPKIGIDWPLPVQLISEKDQNYPWLG
jgi:dTDP-4-dehydrorhamnose 3,5-epimerase